VRLAENLPLRIGPPPSRPRIILSEVRPGPTWVALGPAREPTDSSKLLSATARVLAQYGPSVPLTIRPATLRPVAAPSLTEQADALMASEGLTYRDALRRASIEDPAAYATWRASIRPGVR
jgi:hypothetical protein